MRKLVDEELQCDDSTPAPFDEYSNTPDDNSELIFGADTPSTNSEDLTPNPGQILRLWQIYLDRCNPLTKIIHVPTVQPHVLDATSSTPNLPKNIEALLFAIYTLAVVSMTKEESEDVLGMPKEKALARFSAGLRSCMIRLGFLKTHDLITLQALVIYLVRVSSALCSSNWMFLTDCCRFPYRAGTTAMHPGSSTGSSFASPRRWACTAMVRCWD
jgi:hypothetical protein